MVKQTTRKHIYFFIGSKISVVDITTNRVINTSQISQFFDFSNEIAINSVDFARSIGKTYELNTLIGDKQIISQFGYDDNRIGLQFSISLGESSLKYVRSILDITWISLADSDSDLPKTNNTLRGSLELISRPEILNHLVITTIHPRLEEYPLRVRPMADGRQEIAFTDPSDPSTTLRQLNGFDITSLMILPSNMSNQLFRGLTVMLFANRFMTYVSINPNAWTPLR